MAKIRRMLEVDSRLTVETEDGRLFQYGRHMGWYGLPALPEYDEEREQRELEERVRGLGLTVPGDE